MVTMASRRPRTASRNGETTPSGRNGELAAGPGAEPRALRPSAAVRRRQREKEILAATRELFDARGVRDAQIEDIARAVGINRAIIYRHFSGKEELFALTLVGYLEEIEAALKAADDPNADPASRLRAVSTAFLEYGEEYPAFVDCALALLRYPGEELVREVSEVAVFRLGRGMATALSVVVHVLNAGVAAGTFRIANVELLANVLYTQALGGLLLARSRVSVGELAPGLPAVAKVSFDEVREYLVEAAVAMAVGLGSEHHSPG